MSQIVLRSVTLAFGGPPVLDGVVLRVDRGERICLIGRNGEGKTSLATQLAMSLAHRGRRTVLAEWMTSPTNPRTSRVMVNRLWQHHFGRGIYVG